MDDDGNFSPMETWQSLVQFEDEEDGSAFEDLAYFCENTASGPSRISHTIGRLPGAEKVRKRRLTRNPMHEVPQTSPNNSASQNKAARTHGVNARAQPLLHTRPPRDRQEQNHAAI